MARHKDIDRASALLDSILSVIGYKIDYDIKPI